MKLEALSFGGMLTSMWTWSGMGCPSMISTPLHMRSRLRISPQVPAVLVADRPPSILWREHDEVPAQPFRVREHVGLLGHSNHLPSRGMMT